MKLEITVVEQPGVIVATLTGSINAANAEEAYLRLTPLAAIGGKMVLDASALEYVSSAGLRLMLQLQRGNAAAGGRVILAGLNPEVSEVMLVTGFLRHFTQVKTLAEALNV